MKIKEDITDEQVKHVANLLLKTPLQDIYTHFLEKIVRYEYDPSANAEACVEVHCGALVKNELYKTAGWKDELVMIKIIFYDRYHDFSYFAGYRSEIGNKTWKAFTVSNYLEAVYYLINSDLIES